MTESNNPHSSKRAQSVIIIQPPADEPKLNIKELWLHRSVLMGMIRRNIKINFGELHFGILWAVVRPLVMVAVFVLLKNMSGAQMGVPIDYSLYLLSGLMIWFYFVEVTSAAANSLQSNSGFIQKMYFPRLYAPIAEVFSKLIGPVLAIVPLAIMMIIFGEYPGWRLLLLPVVLLQCMALALAAGAIFATLILYNRDWERVLSLLLYIGLFLSPVIYTPAIMPIEAQYLFNLNPMSGILLAFRSVFFDGFPFPLLKWIYSLGITVIALPVGLYLFQKAEKDFTDQL